ncbi:MAG: response regulator, partial [Prolixibacteraceae bacterium]|nr:response regulator [Prolixibacteraceae bacterium]
EASYKFLDVMLSKLGMNIIWAKNAAGAIKSCNENTDISLVLMDVNLPEMNGFDATREIKKSRPDLPVIAQTAYALTGDREKSIAAGCHDYITKPINQNLLIELIKKTI